MNEYDDLIKQDKQTELRSSVYVAARAQPDSEAALQKLADRWGLPVDTVRAKQPEVELHDRLESFDYERAIKENPKLSSWFADPKNASVAHDDFDRLSRLEKALTLGRDLGGAAAQGAVGVGAGGTLTGFAELYDTSVRMMDRGLSKVLPQTVMDALRAPLPSRYMNPSNWLRDPGTALKQAGDYVAPPQQRQNLATDVAQGIGQLGFQISAALVTGGAASTSMLYAQGADQMATKTAKDIADPAARDSAIIAGGAITAITERYGLDKVLNRVPPEVKNRALRFLADKVAAGGIEAGQEFAEGLLQDITRRVLTNPDAELLQGVGREMTAAGLSAAIVRTALGVRGFRQAQQNEQFFKALGEDATQSKLRERLPERFRELVGKYTEDGPVQNVFVPAEKFAEYFQSVGLDPAQAAAEAGVLNFAEAMAAGTDVVIPMADFVAKLAPTDHLQGLMQDLRLRQDEMTMREAKLAEANRDENDAALQAEIARINEAAQSEAGISDAIQRIVSDVEAQLSTRYDTNTARQLATVMRGVAVLAQRANPNGDVVAEAQKLWERYGLNVQTLATQDAPQDGTVLNQGSVGDPVQGVQDGGAAPAAAQAAPEAAAASGVAAPAVAALGAAGAQLADVQTATAAMNQDKRGSIEIGTDRRIRINLFEKANLSTFMHEAGHFYLEVLGDLAQDANADQSVRDDYARILEFLGVSDRSQIKVEHHEKFARANEAYLMEGKAPSPELRGVFQRFRAWLKLIYRQLTALDVELSDDVRGVFDRIYATDAEIDQAAREADLSALFLDAQAAGMTEAEFAAYRDDVAKVSDAARDELQTKLMRVERLKREAWWRDERARVAEQVAAELDATPAAQALARLAPTDSDIKLNRGQLVERYGETITKRLPRNYGAGKGVVYSDDGIDIDTAAELLGFDSADTLISELSRMPRRSRYIAAESDRIMGERHGDLLNDIALADEAMLALHNSKREQVLKIELRALNRSITANSIHVDSIKRIAKGMIGQKQVRDIAPHSYLIAERKAAREAFKEMSEGGNRVKAFEAKQRELLNHYLYREAVQAKQDADKIRDYLKAFETDKRRAQVGKAGADYLEQIDGILERYEFKRVTQREIVKRESLAAWLNKQEAEGNAVAIPAEVLDTAGQRNWQQVPIDELRAVRDAVKNIAHLSSLKNKLIRKRQMIDFDMVVGELVDAVKSSKLTPTGDFSTPNEKALSLKQRAAAKWRQFDAEHLKMEQLVEWLDGGRIDGPWARYFFDLADEAQTTEYDLHAAVTTKLQALSESMPKAWRDSLMDRTAVRLPGFDQPMTRFDLLSIAMNMGNEQNLQRLRDGYRLEETDLEAVRNALTGEDWRYVQGVWDTLETLWPELAALEKRASGLEPEKVEAQSFEAAGQTWRGGYFPLVYDPRRSEIGAKQAAATDSVQSFVAQDYGRASTDRGATKARVDVVKAPLLLDYEHVITSHLAKVIKDISHREAVIGLNKILTNAEVKTALIERAGEARYNEMRKWMQVLVNDRSDTLHGASGFGRMFMKARTNMAIVTMGWKISTMMAQFTGFGMSLDNVKPQFLGKALIEAGKHPVETWAFVQEKSGEMRNRANTIERDVKDSLLRMRGERGTLASVRRSAFYLTAQADRIVSVPTWLGAYRQALAEGKSEETAIRAGDRAVRLSQGAGGAKDLAAVQRNNELMKLLTMYYTPFNVLYARLRDLGHQTATQGIGYLPAAVARLTAMVMLPAVLGELLAARGPDEDEDEVWWAIRKMLLYPLATIPVVRDFAGYAEAGLISATGEGKMEFAPDYKISPIVSAIAKIARTPGKIKDAMEGERDFDETAWDVFEASGYIAGLPTAQPRITGEYLVDLLSGDATPENGWEIARDALFRRKN